MNTHFKKGDMVTTKLGTLAMVEGDGDTASLSFIDAPKRGRLEYTWCIECEKSAWYGKDELTIHGNVKELLSIWRKKKGIPVTRLPKKMRPPPESVNWVPAPIEGIHYEIR